MPNTNPRVSADEMRIKLDAAAQEPQPDLAPFDPLRTELPPPRRPASAPTPDLSSKPPAGVGVRLLDGEEVYALALWESRPLPGGDVAVLLRVPESLVQALQAEAANLNLSLPQMLADVLSRASENGWL